MCGGVCRAWPGGVRVSLKRSVPDTVGRRTCAERFVSGNGTGLKKPPWHLPGHHCSTTLRRRRMTDGPATSTPRPGVLFKERFMKVQFCPAQQRGYEKLRQLLPLGHVFALSARVGTGRTTLLRRLHAEEGGAF